MAMYAQPDPRLVFMVGDEVEGKAAASMSSDSSSWKSV